MGYTTDFSGSFQLDKPLTPSLKEFLTKLADTRRMGRDVEGHGVQGEFFVDGTGFAGQDSGGNVIDGNTPPTTQPGLWLQWKPSEDGTEIEWDGGEKFYHYTEWLFYLIHKILIPNGYTLNGEVMWQGEETGDVGKIFVEDNKVFTEPYGGVKTEFNEPINRVYVGYGKGKDGTGYAHTSMELDVVYKDSALPTSLPDEKEVEEALSPEDKEKAILQAKIDALTEIAKGTMNPSLVDKVLEEVEQKFK